MKKYALICAVCLFCGCTGKAKSTTPEPASMSQTAISILLINEYPEIFTGDRLIDGLTQREYDEMILELDAYLNMNIPKSELGKPIILF